MDLQDAAHRIDAALCVPVCAPLDPPLFGSPQARWLLLALHQHLRRQAWAAEVVRERLGIHPDDMAACRHADVAPDALHGRVPGLDEWRCEFHGRGCCLTHDNGTVLDVDFPADHLDLWFFGRYVETVAQPSLAELSLRRPRPLHEFWHADVTELEEAGWLRGRRLTAEGRAWAAILERIEQADSDLVRRACVWGDYALAMSAPLSGESAPQLGTERQGPSPKAWVAEQADHQRRARIEMLSRRWRERPDLRATVLPALCEIGRDVAEPFVLEALDGTLDGVVSRALAMVATWDGEALAGAVRRTFDRASATMEAPAPWIRARAAEWLMRHRELSDSVKVALMEGLSRTGTSSDAAFGFLLALLDERAGVEALRTALSSDIPCVRTEAVAALTMLGTRAALEALAAAAPLEAGSALARLDIAEYSARYASLRARFPEEGVPCDP